jgi:hypothetical protein
MLVLQDPADPLNDLGRKTFGYKHIRATIMSIQRNLNWRLKRVMDPEISLLSDLVGPSYEAYKGRRAMAEAYGRAALADNLPLDGSCEVSSNLATKDNGSEDIVEGSGDEPKQQKEAEVHPIGLPEI